MIRRGTAGAWGWGLGLVALALGPTAPAQDGAPLQERVRPPASEGARVLVEQPAADPVETFVTANAAYERGDYAQAAALYGRLLDGGRRSGALHYNHGNALLRDGQLGAAVAAYRRALALEPRNQDAAANLLFSRRSARDAIEPPAPSPALRTLFFWHWSASRAELVRAGALLSWLFFGLLVLRRRRRQWAGLVPAAGAVLGLWLALAGSLLVHALRPSRVAVILPPEIEVHSGTDRESVVRFRLHAGTELRAGERRGAWQQVLLPDGQQGFVETRHVAVVQ